MTAELAGWMGHPVTMTLGAVLLASLFFVLELLLHSLAQLGNVRFQGILDEHEKLFAFDGELSLHLWHVTPVLRWIELVMLGVLWLTLTAHPALTSYGALAVAVGLPVVVIAIAWFASRGMGEDEVAFLLRLMQPVLAPAVALMARRSAEPDAPEEEEEEEEASEREIRAFLAMGEAAGIFEKEEGEFLESLVSFFDTTVREVMTPRTDMVAVQDTVGLPELVEAFATSHKSRIPVYSDTVDHILGFVHVKSVVEHLQRGDHPPVVSLVRDCLVVPESKKLGELLKDFQVKGQQLAIVVDEYGGTAGLVTAEDVIEEIVGDIVDEHETDEPPEVEDIGGGLFRLQGRASLEVLEDLFGVEVEEEDVDTVGGLVFARYGTVPEPGAEVDDAGLGLHFVVEDVQDRRIVAVLARRLVAPAEAPVANG